MNERADGVNRFLGRRPLALFALCYGVGALAGYYAHVPPLWYGVPGALALVAFALRRRAVLLLIALALIGASLTGFSARRPAFPVDETALSISGRVAEPPGWNGTSGVMALERVTLGDGRAYPWRLRVYVYGEQLSAHAGDAVSFTGELFEPKGRTNPGGFDFARFLWARGTPLCASAKPETLAISPGASWVGALRERITRAIERAFPGNAPLAQALVLGDKSALSDALADDFRIAGLSHLLAVSGLHISCLALALERLLRLLRCGRRASLCVTLLLLAAYAGLIGFPASVLRAALMFALVRSAPLFGRPADALTGLSAAFVLILLTRPLSIGDAGFQLSFAAVGSMLLLREPVQKLLRMPGAFRWPGFSDVRVALRWLWAWACNLFCVSVAVQLGTLPVLVMTFGAVSLLSPLVNLVAIPLSSLALPLVALRILMPVAWFTLPDQLLGLLSALAGRAARLSGPLCLPAWPGPVLIAYGALCLLASPYVRIRLRVRKLLLLSLPCLAVGAALFLGLALPGGLNMVFLDAGQADACVVRAQGHTYAVDLGKPGSPLDDYLVYTGQRPDALFLTHPHADHAGGLEELLDRLTPGAIYLPECWERVSADPGIPAQIERARAMGVKIEHLKAGDVVALSEGVACEVLQPAEGIAPGADNGNAASLVLRIRYGDGSALLTGDLSSDSELPVYPDVDVLKAAHHGAKSSNSASMLALTKPSALVISVGRNGYGHPADRVLDTASSLGASVYRTDACGAVTAQIDEDGTATIRTFLNPEETK